MIRITETTLRDAWPPRTRLIKDQTLRCTPNSFLTPEATPRGWSSSLMVGEDLFFICQTPYLGSLCIEWEPEA